MRTVRLLVLAVLAAACAARTPRVPFVDDVDAFVAAHPLAAGQNIRADEIGRTASASYHVVQVRDREQPHRHLSHDLTVVVLRGRGIFTRGEERSPLRAGDLVVVARGEPHWFANDGRAPAVSFVVFAPPLDAPDIAPVEVR